jgi:hypothetical protein
MFDIKILSVEPLSSPVCHHWIRAGFVITVAMLPSAFHEINLTKPKRVILKSVQRCIPR